MIRYDFGLSAVFAAIACYVLHASSKFPPSETVGVGPAYWPSFLGYCLLLLSVALFIEALIKRHLAKSRESDEAVESEKPPIDFRSRGMACVYLLCGVFAIFSVLVYFVNFIVAIIFLVPACMVILGEKRPLVLVAVTTAVPVVVYVIFTMILRVDLPSAY